MRAFNPRTLATAVAASSVALILGACGSSSTPSTSSTPPASATPTASPTSDATFAKGAVPGSGTGLKVGYISLGDSIPFVKLVSDNIKAQAEVAGVELLFCDSQLDAAKALECARTFKTKQVQGIINFQLDEKAAAQICAAGPDVPVVAVDIHQRPCEKTFMGANNALAGELAGESLGNFFKTKFNCEFDAFVSMEQPAAGQVNTDRAGGAIKGFEKVCGAIPADKLRQVDGGGTIDAGRTAFADTLTALSSKTKIATASLNDDMLLGAFAAAKAQGRDDEIFGVAQGADPSSWDAIQNNPGWVGDTAYFPENYGEIAIPAIIGLIKGTPPVPAELFTEHVFIDKNNFSEFYS